MPKYQVDIPHRPPRRRRQAAHCQRHEKLTRDYGAACTWKGETELSVSRKGLDALVTVEPSRVHIDMNLGFLLTPFAEKIKTGIAKQLSTSSPRRQATEPWLRRRRWRSGSALRAGRGSRAAKAAKVRARPPAPARHRPC